VRKMSGNPNLITRHIFSIFVTAVLTIVISCGAIYINLAIKYGPNPGPFADMAPVGFGIAFCGYCFLLLFLLVLIGVISELGRRVFRNRLNWWASTSLMFLFFTGIHFLISLLFALWFFIIFRDRLTLSLSLPLALDTSIRIGVIGVVYWVALYIFELIFAKDRAASQNANR
jgi:hypothetical protein